jgi:hypothetical protein
MASIARRRNGAQSTGASLMGATAAGLRAAVLILNSMTSYQRIEQAK